MFHVYNGNYEFHCLPIGKKVTTKNYLKATDGIKMEIFAIVIRESPESFRPEVFYRIGECYQHKQYLVQEKFIQTVIG